MILLHETKTRGAPTYFRHRFNLINTRKSSCMRLLYYYVYGRAHVDPRCCDDTCKLQWSPALSYLALQSKVSAV